MNNIVTTLNQIIELFIIMLIGFYCKKKKLLSIATDFMFSEILVNLTLPLLIFISFFYVDFHSIVKEGIELLKYSFVIFILLILISKILFPKIELKKKIVLEFASVFSNCGFMGFPILYSIYGKNGLLYAAIFNIPFDILVWTIGIKGFSNNEEKKSIMKVLKDPNIIALILGILFVTFKVNLPSVINKSLSLIGEITTPLSMILIGSMLSDAKFRQIFKEKSIGYIIFLRLIIIPVFTYIILTLLNVSPLIKDIIVICEAMPVATLEAIIAKKYNHLPEYTSLVVFSTTLFSIFSIPIIILFLEKI